MFLKINKQVFGKLRKMCVCVCDSIDGALKKKKVFRETSVMKNYNFKMRK